LARDPPLRRIANFTEQRQGESDAGGEASELREGNRRPPRAATAQRSLDRELPIERYRSDPFGNHPLFKTEEQARLEDQDDRDWEAAREFDWGD
jgi:hypothetical protein